MDRSSVVPAKVPKLRGQDLIDGFIRQSETEEGISLKLPKEEKVLLLPLTENDMEEEETEVASDETIQSVQVKAEQEEETENEETDEETTPKSVPDDLDDSCFTETLAKIYIKQHRYDKALEIIKKLSLNYPKKNAYFADQIRFLEKLIINAKSK